MNLERCCKSFTKVKPILNTCFITSNELINVYKGFDLNFHKNQIDILYMFNYYYLINSYKGF
jgi:hypothetical protein